MRTCLVRGLCVALLCGAWATAETLDEAVARLTKAAAETRDMALKLTIQGARYETPEEGGKAAKLDSMSGTAELQMLRDGAKCLMRVAASITEERPSREPGAAPEKREERMVAVNDGQFLWTEERRSGQDEAWVVKAVAPAEGGFGTNRGSTVFLDAPFRTTGIKGALDMAGKRAEIRMAGKGAVAGRSTTTIEMSAKGEIPAGSARPAKVVVQFDDATGVAVSGQDLTAAGDVLMAFTATEVKANTGLDKKLFAYIPPEGARVTDRTEPAQDK